MVKCAKENTVSSNRSSKHSKIMCYIVVHTTYWFNNGTFDSYMMSHHIILIAFHAFFLITFKQYVNVRRLSQNVLSNYLYQIYFRLN